jgi:arylsulfatase A-like enzyme|eukprot:COSAG02_NODE_1793_length_10918_cov_41.286533_1_plen_116_part_00
MAPHDWTGEGMRYGDLHDVSSIDAKHAHTVTGNVPCEGSDPENRHCSREFDWNTMCEAMPYWKGQEMKRSYYSCISYVDYMIGQLVTELKTVQLYKDTTVVFWTGRSKPSIVCCR